MGIVKTKVTNYYELDWYVPTEETKKAYLAIKGIVEKGTILPIMADGVGYEWQEEKNSKIKCISKNEFLQKAKTQNVVYFYKDENNYNDLLNYPKDIQKVIDIELYKDGFKSHHILSLKEQLQILKAKHENKIKMRNFNNSLKQKER